ncbi:MAG: hypothetical protein GY914_12400 [Prochlorococcus sp.]|nr:hypothetical protein [Prochlorococcus sp.]
MGCSGELLRLLWGAPGGALESSCGALDSSWAGVGELLGVLWGAPGGALRSYGTKAGVACPLGFD